MVTLTESWLPLSTVLVDACHGLLMHDLGGHDEPCGLRGTGRRGLCAGGSAVGRTVSAGFAETARATLGFSSAMKAPATVNVRQGLVLGAEYHTLGCSDGKGRKQAPGLMTLLPVTDTRSRQRQWTMAEVCACMKARHLRRRETAGPDLAAAVAVFSPAIIATRPWRRGPNSIESNLAEPERRRGGTYETILHRYADRLPWEFR